MNYSYILLVFCAFIYVGVSVTRRVNVVIVNSRNMVFRIFNRQKSLVFHAHTDINEKKVIVANCLHENPEVGTMVSKNAISHVGIFY